jgi:PKHD-type hydroxylase
MLLQIPALLDSGQVRSMRARLDAAAWRDGRMTAGHQSALAKANRQLPQDDATARELSADVLRALERNSRFISGTLPLHVYPPLFNRYEAGMSFGGHVDNAIRQIPGTPHRVRTDISATVFLSEPGEYDGGELVIEDTFGTHPVKLAAGDMVVYPSSSVHRVLPVTRGARTAAFFWIQSMIRDDGDRRLLFNLDTSIQELTQSGANADTVIQLTACYHNLLRRWGEI